MNRPEKSAATKIVPRADTPQEAIVQLRLQHLQKRSTDRWFLGALREPFVSRPMTRQDSERLLDLPLEEVLALFEAEKWKRYTKHSRRRPFFLGLLALGVPLFIFTGYSATALILWSWLIGTTAAVAVSDTQHAAALALARFEDVRAVGPLVEALAFRYTDDVAEQALVRLLPRLQPGDAAMLNGYHRTRLNRALMGANTALILAILTAYEQVGDATALAEVQKLADVRSLKIRLLLRQIVYRIRSSYGMHEIPKEDVPKVAAAAQECLPFLLESTQRRRSDQELLRPSEAHQIHPEILLRPAATHTAIEPPNELLRQGASATEAESLPDR